MEEGESDDPSQETARILLPQILPILKDSLNVSLNTVLSWRLISKQIKLVIDEIFEEEAAFIYTKSIRIEKNLKQKLTQPLLEKTSHRTYLAKELIQKYIFKNGDQVQKFLSHFGAPSLSRASSFRIFSQKKVMSNPFLSRSLHISTVCEGEEDPKIVDPYRALMLETFGYHIRSMTFHISGALLGDSLIHFRALLPLVPNLKCLKICGCAEDWVESEEFVRVVVRLPKLEQLEVLDVQNFKEEFSSFIGKSKFTLNELVVEHYGPQLKTLVCGEALFKRENVGKVLNSGLPNLQTFRLNSVTHSSTLLILSEVEWPKLEELELGGDEDASGGNYDPFSDTIFGQDFVRAVNNFSSSLVHLKLHGVKLASEALVWSPPKNEDDGDDEHKKLVMKPLPKLISLTTELSNLHINWFWNPIKVNSQQLEEIKVQTFSVSIGGLDQLQREFDVLPKLKRIVIYCAYPEGESQPKKIVLTRTL